MKLAMVSGSLRRGSINTAALRVAARYLRADHPEVSATLCPLRSIPLFDEDLEAHGWPRPVQRLRDQIASADAVLICTPEYNGGVSGVLTNALDWVSRPDRTGPIWRKAVATMSASPTRFGAAWAQDQLRFVLEQCQATLINEDPVPLAIVDAAIDADGEITPGTETDAIHRLVDVIVSHLHEPSHRRPVRTHR